jgi:sigma-B regulation protein RsbU (phosphoserine phosphatase)
MTGARLQVRDAHGTWIRLIDTNPFTIGRRETNHLQLVAAEVSREHAELVVNDGRYLLRDRHSRYGTFVGGQSITERQLYSGDHIRLGREGGAELVFFDEGDDRSQTPELSSSGRGALRRLSDLLERLRKLGSDRLLDDVLGLVLDAALEVSGADRGFIMLAADDGKLQFRLGRGPAGHMLTSSRFEMSEKFPEEAFRTGRTRVVYDLFDLENSGHDTTRGLGIRQVICVPLHVVRFFEAAAQRHEDRRLGVLYLDGQEKGSLASETTQSTLEALAAEASIAIEHARMYRETLEKAKLEHELHVAAEIQRSLLPRSLVTLPYVEAAAVSTPCRAVGGDFFDYLRTQAAVFGFTVGDVAGKGPPAALMSAMMQGMFAYAARGQDTGDPASIVANINQALCQREVELRFVTLFFGVLAPDGRLCYCNAGHNPPFVVGERGVRRLPAGGPVVGILGHATYVQDVVALDPGDVVVVFSDGVSEALDANDEEFGEERLLDVIQRAGPGDVQQLVDAILDAVHAFTVGAVQSDDITVMALRYHGAAAPDI